ncbi:uncharacterized protein LOC127859659 [Dreissena polymorpha]|uniref:uncharacterized protein LOC127859659 n=1 Tax=Dreissena polymorpha TaxID=45954 RepID=UPI00226403DE|nr:uncharacterized protein LOC127859659 [Dreissena polymorpha]
MGKQGLGEMNDNGEIFADLCATSQLLRTNRRFCQLQVICQSNAAPPQRKRSAAPSSNCRKAHLQDLTAYRLWRLRLTWRPVRSYYTRSSARYGKKKKFQQKEGNLIKLPKKGDLSSCSNYQRITLLSVPGKVFNRILLNRMKDSVDPHFSDQQAGFRKERSE